MNHQPGLWLLDENISLCGMNKISSMNLKNDLVKFFSKRNYILNGEID